MKTFSAKTAEIERKWYLVDATNQVLGRVASKIAHRLRGKHKPEYTPHVDTGDFIVVVNASKLRVTGNKWTGNVLPPLRLSGRHLSNGFWEDATTFSGPCAGKAVKGMMPKNRLGRAMFAKLKVYPEMAHPHTAQQPQTLEL